MTPRGSRVGASLCKGVGGLLLMRDNPDMTQMRVWVLVALRVPRG